MAGNEFNNALQILEKIRKDCPGDRHRSSYNVIENLKEELDEVKEEIDNGDSEKIAEELGDLFWNVIFLIQTEKEKYGFDFQRVLEKVGNKMVFRHPHVFENRRELSVEEVGEIWNKKKKEEKDNGILH